MYNQTAEQLFNEYRNQTEKLITTFTHLKDIRPLGEFPATSAALWRTGVLAELWGIIASKGSVSHRNYLEEWRTGK